MPLSDDDGGGRSPTWIVDKILNKDKEGRNFNNGNNRNSDTQPKGHPHRDSRQLDRDNHPRSRGNHQQTRNNNNQQARSNYQQARGNNQQARSNNQQARGNNQLARGSQQHARGNNQHARGSQQHSRDNQDQATNNHQQARDNQAGDNRVEENPLQKFYERITTVPKEVQAITLIKLDQLLGAQPEVILQELVMDGRFYKFLENDFIDPKTLEKILQLLNATCQCYQSHFEKWLQLLTRVLNHKKFVEYQLRRYLEMCCQENISKAASSKALENFGSFLLYGAKFHPASITQAIGRLQPAFGKILKKKLEAEILRLLQATNDHIETFSASCSKEEIQKLARLEVFHSIDPESNFRTLSTLPNLNSLLQEPFVRPNLVRGKFFSLEHYLDVQYRLFREDMLRYLREGVQAYRKHREHPDKLNRLDNVNIYQNCEVIDVFILDDSTRNHHLKFPVKNLDVDWETTSRFTFGSLVALSTDYFTDNIIYGRVDERDVKGLRKGKLVLKLENLSETMNREIITCNDITLIETSIFLQAYLPPLKVIAEAFNAFMPFSDYIVFGNEDVKPPGYLKDKADVCYDLRPLCQPYPPRYQQILSKEEIMLSLMLNKKMPAHEYDFPSRLDSCKSIKILQPEAWPKEKDFQFDKHQLKAFQSGITKEFALIQGPPGTGKTFIGLRLVQVLLHNKLFWGPSPILVVCFKNHALDQFLEGVLSLTTKVVRLGSNSKSEILTPYVLRNIINYCSPQKDELNQKRNQIEEECSNNKELLGLIKKKLAPFSHLKEFMVDKHLQCFKEDNETNICSGDEDGALAYWLGVGNDCDINNGSIEAAKSRMKTSRNQASLTNKRHQPFKKEEDLVEIDSVLEMREYSENPQRSYREMQNSGNSCSDTEDEEVSFVGYMVRTCQPLSFDSMESIKNIWALDYKTRWQLYCFWIGQLKAFKNRELVELEKNLRETNKNINTYNRVTRKEICKNADVIGITTSGAAIMHELLTDIEPRIILVEEAAEILEAHTISCLTEKTDHMILIGDHKQLQPTTSVHDLTVNYDLNISLFERVINNGIKSCCLVCQHRMRPQIAQLLYPHIYETLSHHTSVKHYKNILGLTSNIFFLSHKEMDKKKNGTTSFYNTFEAKFLFELSKYLIYQGYSPSQITILATYTGQVFEIKELVGSSNLCKDIRVTTVDNFQGEENDIILISFVRSNALEAIGFLKISNRVCVALSRARKGFYCIGNFSLMASQSDLWNNIYRELCTQNAINNLGDIQSGMMLRCQNHPDHSIVVRRPDDFKKTNLGGCQKNCGFKFDCGHICNLTCHIYDREHKLTRCQQPCEKEVCKQHHCTKVCSRPCGDCETLVFKTLPLCGHSAKMACSRDPFTFVCSLMCTKKLPCGDICQSQCTQVCQPCKMERPVRAKCQHIVKVECHISEEEAMSLCKEKCQAKLECGHFCQGSCSECWQGRLHKLCKEKCNKVLLCGHSCQSLCYELCPPCPEKCRDICAHSHCPRSCGNRCMPCTEACSWVCIHEKCTKKCSELCNRTACNEPCQKLLEPCGHRCTGFCGEPCPECPRCNDSDLLAPISGIERFITLEECDHRISLKQLAPHFESDRVIEAVQVKECPLCQTPIYKNKRFKNQIMRMLDNIHLIIEKVFGTLKERRNKTFEIINRVEKVQAIYVLGWFPAATEILTNLPARIEETRTLQDLNMILNILDTMEFAGGFAEYLDILDSEEFPFKSNSLQYLETFLDMLRAFLETLGCSQMSDIQQESRRLTAFYRILQWRTSLSYAGYGVDSLFNKILSIFLKPQPFTRKLEDEISMLFKEALKKQGEDSVPAFVQLKLFPIMRAVRNQWFSCKEGHFLWKRNGRSSLPPSSCFLCKK